MSSSHSSSLPPTPLKSKNQPKSVSTNSPAPMLTQTPEKSSTGILPPRLRNRGVALSLTEIRKAAAQGDRVGPRRKDVKSARRQIASWPEESAARLDPKSGSSPVADEPPKMPEKYEMLGEFFDGLDSSIRLLRLKGSMSTFTNICPKIQCLTDRRFSHRHLAQLKFILPEAIEMKKVLIFDERTSCMKPDLHVTINFDAIEYDGNVKAESKNMHLRKVFRSRLADFYSTHPEDDEVPEGLLPEPFNNSKQVFKSVVNSTPALASLIEINDTQNAQSPISSLHLQADATEEQKATAASHLSKSFRRHFSQKVASNNTESTETCAAPDLSPELIGEENGFSTTVTEVTPTLTKDEQYATSCADERAIKTASIQSTPAKVTSTVLMSTTPLLHTPKRCCMSPDDDPAGSPNKLVRRMRRTRSLKFEAPTTHTEDETNVVSDASEDDDILNILPESVLQSIREKERKAKEEQDPAISQAKRRRQMIACLPKIFNMIHFLFQSMNKSVITKQELVHKIIASHLDIVDRREVEEQINLLLEIVPEWISEKLASTGDFLLRINKMSSAETIRAQLEGAK